MLPQPHVLFLLQCLGVYKRDVGPLKTRSEDTHWFFGGGALGQEAGSRKLEDEAG